MAMDPKNEGVAATAGRARQSRSGNDFGAVGGDRANGTKSARDKHIAPGSLFPDWWPHSNGSTNADASADAKDNVPPNLDDFFNMGGLQQPMTPLHLTPEGILGEWLDTAGNKVTVCSTDAYELRLIATLSRPPRADILLQIWPMPGSFWQCGNAILDPQCSTENALHWVGSNGRNSVWVRLEQDVEDAGDQTEQSPTTKAVDEANKEVEDPGNGAEKGPIPKAVDEASKEAEAPEGEEEKGQIPKATDEAGEEAEQKSGGK